MLPVFSVLGGAALVELGKRIAHKGGDGDAKQNKQREQKLRIFLEVRWFATARLALAHACCPFYVTFSLTNVK